MSKQHLCRNRPHYRAGADPWLDGPVAGCPYHGRSTANARRVKMSKTDRAKADREAGVLGRQNEMGSYTGTPGKDW